MARLQIPLDVLTSRLNLSDRFASVRSQSITGRFANLKPISEFLDLKRLSKPSNFSEVQSRVNYNLGHFSSNYAVVFVMLSIYSLLTNWLLLFVIILVVGGMWGIGKLEGSDLDLGFVRASSSQLYTGLLVVTVPLGIFASPISTILWLIGASGVSILGHASFMDKPIDEAFSGEAGSKRRKQWEREQAMWQNEVRVEELDSDDTDTQGVGLNFEKKRFASDPLHFTGIDLSSSSRARRSYTYDTEESSSDSGISEVEGTDALQIALRDKEEALVQSALARIRRAQEKGKREVKLNQDELDALEKRRKRMQAAATTRNRKGSGSSGGSGSEKRRRSDRDRNLITVPIAQPSSRKGKSKRLEEIQPHPPAATNPPGMLFAGPDGLTYAPIGQYPPQGTRNSPTRQRPASSGHSRGEPPPQLGYPTGPFNRHYSDGMRPTSSSSSSSRRPLPDEQSWLPAHSRRSSVSSQSSVYQTSSVQLPPIPQQYSRHNVSGPEIAYSSLRRSPPESKYPAAARASDPALRRKSSHRDELANSESSSDAEDDESDDLGNGVQVYVEEKEKEKAVVARKPVGGSSRRKGKR
ncbi:Prenylated Rab acceptor [Lachnellula subtilissima]|uniref:Prenylated Rab acceptor n=1 Tax=Lachnellula subtilissima TaxID=602034 RepID=A0A8H8U8E2_9HELO|nr:Prenylated Rab acceptor [Lachnellula subtilissima]